MPGYQPLGKFPPFHQSEGKVSFSQIRGGVINAEEIILAGGTKGRIRSENYDPTNETGWGIFGDGSASFYGDVFFGENAIFQGDLYSANWDGTIPIDLSSYDVGATAGFALDSSEGTAQFMGDLFLGGNLTLFGSGLIRTESGDAATQISEGSIIFESGDANEEAPAQIQGGITDPLGTGAKGAITLTSPLDAALNYSQLNLTWDGAWLAGVVGNSTAWMLIESDQSINFGFGSSTTMSIKDGAALLPAGSASAPGIAFTSDTDTGMYRSGSNELSFSVGGSMKLQLAAGRVDINDALRILDGSAANPAIRFSADTNTGIYRHGTDATGFASGGTTRLVVANSGVHVGFGGNHSSGGSGLFVWDLLKDIGNHEVLRAARGAGTQTTEVGYFSSWEFDPDTGERRKEDIVSLAESPRWSREWFYKIRPVDFRRISTGEREFGFLLDEWKATADDMKYLTTKGDRWGSGPHETALLAATILEVQDHERRIRELEAEVAVLRDEKEKHA